MGRPILKRSWWIPPPLNFQCLSFYTSNSKVKEAEMTKNEMVVNVHLQSMRKCIFSRHRRITDPMRDHMREELSFLYCVPSTHSSVTPISTCTRKDDVIRVEYNALPNFWLNSMLISQPERLFTISSASLFILLYIYPSIHLWSFIPPNQPNDCRLDPPPLWWLLSCKPSLKKFQLTSLLYSRFLKLTWLWTWGRCSEHRGNGGPLQFCNSQDS